MKRQHFIGLDVHCQWTHYAVVTQTGQLIHRGRCTTTIPALVEVLESIPRPRYVAFEEGPLADWLWRNLAGRADEIKVCNPRRNHLIAKESDKDDPIDAEKLAQLYRGGYLKEVHHPETLERMLFKQHVSLYHQGVRQRVREVNKSSSLFRRFGVFVREKGFAEAEQRTALLARLPGHSLLRDDVQMLWQGYDLAAQHVKAMRRRLVDLARQEEVVRRFVEVPGFQWVRAATFFVLVDTPWRFASKSALWRYLGLGLERRGSGNGPLRVRLAHVANRTLKGVMIGAAKSAIRAKDNPFADQYRRWLKAGVSPGVALRNTARSLAATLWGMWKNGSAYHPEWVGVSMAALATLGSAPADGCS